MGAHSQRKFTAIFVSQRTLLTVAQQVFAAFARRGQRAARLPSQERSMRRCGEGSRRSVDRQEPAKKNASTTDSARWCPDSVSVHGGFM